MAVTPPKVTNDIQQGGGRHYRGAGLGTLKVWQCPACYTPNSGPFTQGCEKCGAGKPGTQVRKPGDAIPPAPAPPVAAEAPRRPRPLAEQLRQRASNIDYDEIERRVGRVLDSRLGGGYTDLERARLYDALEVLIALWEEGTITPQGGLSLDATRQLAQKVAPDTGLEFEERAYGSPTETTAPADTEADAGEGNPDTSTSDHDSGDREYADPRTLRPAAQQAAPQLVDPDFGGDQGGQDDSDSHGGGVPV